MKEVFVGVGLFPKEYRAFKTQAEKAGRTVRGHMRFLARKELEESESGLAGRKRKTPVVPPPLRRSPRRRPINELGEAKPRCRKRKGVTL